MSKKEGSDDTSTNTTMKEDGVVKKSVLVMVELWDMRDISGAIYGG